MTNNIYRDGGPSGNYDLLIVSLVHQPPEMIYYMMNNIQKYVEGNVLWVVHYNNAIPIDENTLPDWVWLVRDVHSTTRFSYALLFGIQKCLNFAIESGIQFINALVFSSGCGFFRKFKVPLQESVCFKSHEDIINPNAKLHHLQPIGIEYAGKCGDYLKSIGSIGWQYSFEESGADRDTHLHTLMKKQNFKYFIGAQAPGQVFPFNVAKMLVEDIAFIMTQYDSAQACTYSYCPEEIYLSTYAYNYAINHHINIELTQVITNWEFYYHIEHIQYIINLRNQYPYGGAAVSKIPDNLNHPVRIYLNQS